MALTIFAVSLCGSLAAQTVLQRSVIAQGAVSASGGGYSISATLRQPIIATARASTHAGFFGFWYTPDRVVINIERIAGPKTKSASVESIDLNPAHGEVSIHFAVHSPGATRVTMHDMLGRELCLLDDSFREAGHYALPFQPRPLAPGRYIVRLNTVGPKVYRRFIVER